MTFMLPAEAGLYPCISGQNQAASHMGARPYEDLVFILVPVES